MSLIKPKSQTNTQQFRARIDLTVFQEIQAYMKWANIDSLDYFIEEAAKLVFDKDKNWKAAQNK